MRSSAVASAVLFLIGCTNDPTSGPHGAPSAPSLLRAAATYTVLDISAGNIGDTHAWSINADNQVAGWAGTPRGVRGWVWTGGVRKLLPLSPGAIGSEAYGISPDGRVVGYVFDGTQMYPAYWRNQSSRPVLLPTIGGVTDNMALGVNSSGRVTGHVFDRNNNEQAFVWEASTGAFSLLGTLGGASSSGHDVNELGTVTGCADDAAGNPRAFKWTSVSGSVVLADRYSGSSVSCGRGINRQEDIAGRFSGVGGSDTSAVFDATGIPILAARTGAASYWSVNDNQIAVGYADVYALGLRQGIFYDRHLGINVLPPLTAGAGAEARDINGCGRIVGSGYPVSSAIRALMWVPSGC